MAKPEDLRAIHRQRVPRMVRGLCAREGMSRSMITHGEWHTPLHRTWVQMVQRCTNPRQRSYQWYGARGVRVCERWRKSYVAFRDDMGPRPKGMSLDRIDPTGDYTPQNCRWATPTEQAANTRQRAYMHLWEPQHEPVFPVSLADAAGF